HISDFSGVLFQSDFVLVSKKNHMKTHKNQWVWAAPHLPEPLSEAISRGPTVAPEAQKPSQCLDRVRPHSDRGLQLLENKALSWGIIRKSACILAEITIRESQPLAIEGYRRQGNQHVTQNQDDIGPLMTDDIPLAVIECFGVFRMQTGPVLQRRVDDDHNFPGQAVDPCERLGKLPR